MDLLILLLLALSTILLRYDPPKCHPSTRVAVLEHIMSWTMDFRQISFFMWLYGPATGAPSHSQSLNYATRQTFWLPVSSCLVRLLVDGSRLTPTLVCQLCLPMPAIRKYVEDTIEQDPLVVFPFAGGADSQFGRGPAASRLVE